jgi:hypothetical protein
LAEEYEGKFKTLPLELGWGFTPSNILLGRYKSSPYHLIQFVNHLALQRNNKSQGLVIGIN